MKAILYNLIRRLVGVAIVIAAALFMLTSANANVFSNTLELIKSRINKTTQATETPKEEKEQVLRVSSKAIISDEDKNAPKFIAIADNNEDTIKTAVGTLRTDTDEEITESSNIIVYEVKTGDTLSDIAKMYDVTRNTIAWANDIKNGKVSPGDVLIILPVSGVKHIVKKGDTIKSIAKKYKADVADIKDYNLISDDTQLAVGDELIVPDGQVSIDAPAPPKSAKKKVYASASAGYYVRPIIGGIKTQGIHGHNGVDIGAKIGTPILAAAGGTVQVARSSGYNGGYGSMVIISHPNGTQTVYGHMSRVLTQTGDKVVKGQQIGEVGNTGKSTGPHLHFEIRGAVNPF